MKTNINVKKGVGLRIPVTPLTLPFKSPEHASPLIIPGDRESYSQDQATEIATKYFNGDELAASAWVNKYAMKDSSGNYMESTPQKMHKRMAHEFARIEEKYSKDKIFRKINKQSLSPYGRRRENLGYEMILRLFEKFEYVIPQGSVMSSLGNKNVIASLSNCIVLPELYDSYGGVFFADQELAQLFKRRCGVGLDLSPIRPAGLPVSNAAGTTTGTISFMERFSNTTREVAQNGRRGALMLTLDIAHPDVEKFVTIKQDLQKVTGANISVRLSDEFMLAVENDTDFTLRWPIESASPTIIKTIKARELWNTIIKCAHNTAEPGLIFWDRQHKYSTSSIYPGYKNVSTNPCSEIAMQGGDSCRLIAMNLYSFVDNPFTKNATFDYDRWYKITYESQHLMDDLVDLELEAIERILAKIESDPQPDNIKAVERETWDLLYEAGMKARRTGLGFTALADAIAALGFKYDSMEALVEIEKIMKVKCEAEFDSSIDMAIERGKFEAFDPKIDNTSEFTQMLSSELPSVYERMMKHGRRNISISTVAPTGTLSMMSQTSSGIEPVFMMDYKRRKKININDKGARVDFKDKSGDEWQEFEVIHPKLKKWMDITGNKNKNESPYAGSTAPEIDWKNRVAMQAVVQKYTTHSISSTINLPKDVSLETVSGIYLQAWKQGLKGITVYREGSRNGVLVSNDEKKTSNAIHRNEAPVRPKELEAEVVRFMNGEEKWIAYVGLLDNQPYEVFTGKAEDSFNLPEWVEKGWIIKVTDEKTKKSRYDFRYSDKQNFGVTTEGLSRTFNQEYWNYAKFISGVLRHGMPMAQVIHLIENLNLNSDNINTWKSGVERALKKYITNGTKANGPVCTECKRNDGWTYEEGCKKCECGNTLCG